MNKTIRVVLALAFLVAIVAVGMNGTAWADKLGAGNQAPAAAGNPAVGALVQPPAGTVETTGGGGRAPSKEGTGPAGPQPIVIGSIATVLGLEGGGDVTVELFEGDLPGDLPGYVEGTALVLTCDGDTFCGAEVCYKVGPDSTASAHYWDGAQWVEATTEVTDGLACMTIPAGIGQPVYTALSQ